MDNSYRPVVANECDGALSPKLGPGCCAVLLPDYIHKTFSVWKLQRVLEEFQTSQALAAPECSVNEVPFHPQGLSPVDHVIPQPLPHKDLLRE